MASPVYTTERDSPEEVEDSASIVKTPEVRVELSVRVVGVNLTAVGEPPTKTGVTTTLPFEGITGRVTVMDSVNVGLVYTTTGEKLTPKVTLTTGLMARA